MVSHRGLVLTGTAYFESGQEVRRPSATVSLWPNPPGEHAAGTFRKCSPRADALFRGPRTQAAPRLPCVAAISQGILWASGWRRPGLGQEEDGADALDVVAFLSFGRKQLTLDLGAVPGARAGRLSRIKFFRWESRPRMLRVQASHLSLSDFAPFQGFPLQGRRSAPQVTVTVRLKPCPRV